MGAVELPVAAEPSGTKFHRPLRCHLRQHFLSTHRRGLLFSRRRPARLRRREMRRTDIKGQLAISERELAKQRRVIEKQLKKKGAPVPERTVMPPEELVGRPKPKVVDTTALPEDVVLPPRKKPSL